MIWLWLETADELSYPNVTKGDYVIDVVTYGVENKAMPYGYYEYPLISRNYVRSDYSLIGSELINNMEYYHAR